MDLGFFLRFLLRILEGVFIIFIYNQITFVNLLSKYVSVHSFSLRR